MTAYFIPYIHPNNQPGIVFFEFRCMLHLKSLKRSWTRTCCCIPNNCLTFRMMSPANDQLLMLSEIEFFPLHVDPFLCSQDSQLVVFISLFSPHSDNSACTLTGGLVSSLLVEVSICKTMRKSTKYTPRSLTVRP